MKGIIMNNFIPVSLIVLMDKYLEKCNLPKQPQEEIEHPNNATSIKDTEFILLTFSKEQKYRTIWLHWWSPQTFNDVRNILIFHRIFQKIEEFTSQHILLWGQYYTDTETRLRYPKEKKVQTNISRGHKCRNPYHDI